MLGVYPRKKFSDINSLVNDMCHVGGNIIYLNMYNQSIHPELDQNVDSCIDLESPKDELGSYEMAFVAQDSLQTWCASPCLSPWGQCAATCLSSGSLDHFIESLFQPIQGSRSTEVRAFLNAVVVRAYKKEARSAIMRICRIEYY